jgi:hypothetical protein
MKTQLVITDADPIFLAALMETMAAMQAEKDQGDETESFVDRFADFETPDLEWIRDRANSVLTTRAAIPETDSYSTSTATRSETFLSVFRYFRNPDGDEWKMPITGEKGYVKQRGHTEWDVSCSKLANFADDSGPIGDYMEFVPNPEIRLSPKSEIASLLERGLSLVGDSEYSEDGSAWISEAEDFLIRHGIAPATLHVPGDFGPLVGAFGNPVTSLDEPEESPTLQADDSHDQASS